MSVEELLNRKRKDYLENKDNEEHEPLNKNDKKVFFRQRIRQRISENKDWFQEHDLQYIRNNIWKVIEDETELHRNRWMLSSYERAEILDQIMNSMFGYGILDNLIHDPSITEIMVNGLTKVYVEKEGKLELARDRRGEPLRFENGDELKHVIEKIVSPLNRKINESDPIVDARLPNGSRVNIVLQPIAIDGSSLTIRKFPEKPYTMKHLVRFGALPAEVDEWLERLVKARYNILISGGTGSGKTTFLNALSMYIPVTSRLITIEDAAELKLSRAENLIRLETRPSNIEGKGEIQMRDLVRTALRMRPDRIIVGEVRSGEALDMLQAMNTGHDGSLSTGHANSAVDMLRRLETMVLMAGFELPVQAIRQQIASAIDIVIHLRKNKTGGRKVVEIIELLGMEGDEIQTQTLYHLNEESGELASTGNCLQGTEKLNTSRE